VVLLKVELQESLVMRRVVDNRTTRKYGYDKRGMSHKGCRCPKRTEAQEKCKMGLVG